jgi:hypothetical protein
MSGVLPRVHGLDQLKKGSEFWPGKKKEPDGLAEGSVSALVFDVWSATPRAWIGSVEEGIRILARSELI